MNLSKHFTLSELTFSQTAARKGIDNTPSQAVINNLKRLCSLLEDVRDVCGAPLRISSGYRSRELNKAVGGADTSQHVLGLAADFTANGLSVSETVELIRDAGLDYDQLIHEFNSWIHISCAPVGAQPRRQVLIIDRKGVRAYV